MLRSFPAIEWKTGRPQKVGWEEIGITANLEKEKTESGNGLSSQIENLSKECSALRTDNQGLIETNGDLRLKVTNLEKENSDLKAQIVILEANQKKPTRIKSSAT